MIQPASRRQSESESERGVSVGTRSRWHCRLLTSDAALDDALVQQVYDVFRGAFGFEPSQGPDSIRHRLRSSTVLGLLRDESGDLQGFGCYSMPDVPLGGTYFLWGDGMAVRPAFQGRGLTRGFVEGACSLFPGRRFGWMGGRTQNPVMLRWHAKFGRVFPFDATYAEPEGRAVLLFLREHVAEVRGAAELDEVTGICRRAYRWTYPQEYLDRVGTTEQFEQKLQHWNFRRADGDAIVVVTKLDTPLQSVS